MLHKAWTSVCLIGAATEILARCADADDYGPRRLLAQRPLAVSVSAMHATPALRGMAMTVNPAGSPDDQLAESAAGVVCDSLIAACDALQQAISHVPSGVRPPSAARACAIAAESACTISDIYRAAKAPKPADQAAASRPRHLQALTAAELQAAISEQLQNLSAVDPYDTSAALVSIWYGFSSVSVLGQYLALLDADAAVLHENALPVFDRIIETMTAAPSLPSDVHGISLDMPSASDPAMLRVAHRGICELTIAINALLPEARRHARHEADQLVTETCTPLAAELADCYQGRLRTFLNPYGRKPGAESVIIRGSQGRKKHSGGHGTA